MILTFPIIYPQKYYLQSNERGIIRDAFIQSYNNQPNERKLSLLLMMKLYNEDYAIYNKMKFQINHKCNEVQECYLDEKVFNISSNVNDKEIIIVSKESICFCEEGIKYFFRILKLINKPKLLFSMVDIPFKLQSFFSSFFSHLSNLQVLDVQRGGLTFRFVETFVKSIPFMKLEYVNLSANPIGPEGFRLLLPYLHLLINKDNKMDLYGMRLNDESIILLSEELCKYPNLDRIGLKQNSNIQWKGLKTLFSKFPISKVEFDFRGNKKLLNDKHIPKLVKYIYELNELNLSDSEIDDETFKSFMLLRLNEMKKVKKLDLSYNRLTDRSVEILIDNLSSLSSLTYVKLNENEIGDCGMIILSQHLHLIKDCYKCIYCSNMGLTSIGLKYLVDGLRSMKSKYITLDISENDIDEDGIEYLMDYQKENDCIRKLEIDNNPIGNKGLRMILNNSKVLVFFTLNVSNTSINDDSVMILTKMIEMIKGYTFTINLKGNNSKMKGLETICSKSLEKEEYSFIEMNNPSWTNEELEYYLNYCIKKTIGDYNYDFSNLNIKDSQISLIKQIDYEYLDLSSNRITSVGLKELTDSLQERVKYISVYNNQIGDDGIEIICEYIEKFVNNSLSINLSNIGMSGKGLAMLLERLEYYTPIKSLILLDNMLDERELRLMRENHKILEYLEELSITLKDNIDKSEFELFLKRFSFIRKIKLKGVKEEGKKEKYIE